MKKIITTGMGAVLSLGLFVPMLASAAPLPSTTTTTATTEKATGAMHTTSTGTHITKGVVKSVSTNSLTITVGSSDYTVNTVSAKILNKRWTTIPFVTIKSGDSVRVAGIVTGTTINAHVVRDMSVSKAVAPTVKKTTKNPT